MKLEVSEAQVFIKMATSGYDCENHWLRVAVEGWKEGIL